LPASASLPPFVDWPEDLADLVRGEVVMLEGGHEYDGRPDRTAGRDRHAATRPGAFRAADHVGGDRRGLLAAERRVRDAGGGDPARGVPRRRADAVARAGRIGLLERENATLLNAALVGLARRTTQAFNRGAARPAASPRRSTSLRTTAP
jgi:hypothetical protein